MGATVVAVGTLRCAVGLLGIRVHLDVTKGDKGQDGDPDGDHSTDRRGDLHALDERVAGHGQDGRADGRGELGRDPESRPERVTSRRGRRGRDVARQGPGDVAAVDRDPDAAQDRDPERAAQLGTGLGDARGRTGALRRRGARR